MADVQSHWLSQMAWRCGGAPVYAKGFSSAPGPSAPDVSHEGDSGSSVRTYWNLSTAQKPNGQSRH